MSDEIAEKPMSRWWAAAAVSAGFIVAVLVGQITGAGTAEIAGIMAASLILCARAFWKFRVEPWYLPLIVMWTFAHLAGLIFVVVPMHPHDSRLLINLVWPEFIGFAGLAWLSNHLWGGPAI